MKNISILICLLWMGFIFYNSSNSGVISQQMSRKVTRLVQNESGEVTELNKMNFEKLNYIVRKNAHAFEYIVLAFMVSNALFAFNKRGKKVGVYILFICLFYAVIDEFHQYFVPGRGSLVSDVLIDFGGSLIGVTFFYLAYYKIYRKYAISRKESLKI
ncbi:VanZ family protein [Clostridium chromiireducens]|uniref:VanZ family protein n=1 Tax=Clostridium chromiireducens TaxID=225345 RepID=UPI003AF61582